jgi:hypothetical protein
MPDQEKPANPAIDAAIAAAAAPKQVNLQIQLSGGRMAIVSVPVPITPEDAARVMTAFGSFFFQNFDAEQKATAGGRIILPS